MQVWLRFAASAGGMPAGPDPGYDCHAVFWLMGLGALHGDRCGGAVVAVRRRDVAGGHGGRVGQRARLAGGRDHDGDRGAGAVGQGSDAAGDRPALGLGAGAGTVSAVARTPPAAPTAVTSSEVTPAGTVNVSRPALG